MTNKATHAQELDIIELNTDTRTAKFRVSEQTHMCFTVLSGYEPRNRTVDERFSQAAAWQR